MNEELFDRLLDHYEQPYHRGQMSAPTHAFEIANPVCGDQVRLELRVVDNLVQEAWFTGQGCIVSQASASQLVEYVEGKSVKDLQWFSETDMLQLLGVRLTATRQRCALLPWSSLRGILRQVSLQQ